MSARPEATDVPPALHVEEDALVREGELKALRRLSKLTESENERVALRAAEVLLRYARDRRREARFAAEPPRAKSDPQPAASEKRSIPRRLTDPPKPAPAFRAVPLSSGAGLSAGATIRHG